MNKKAIVVGVGLVGSLWSVLHAHKGSLGDIYDHRSYFWKRGILYDTLFEKILVLKIYKPIGIQIS